MHLKINQKAHGIQQRDCLSSFAIGRPRPRLFKYSPLSAEIPCHAFYSTVGVSGNQCLANLHLPSHSVDVRIPSCPSPPQPFSGGFGGFGGGLLPPMPREAPGDSSQSSNYVGYKVSRSRYSFRCFRSLFLFSLPPNNSMTYPGVTCLAVPGNLSRDLLCQASRFI